MIFMEKKISVVVPAYNSELTIKRCLNSILSQSYKNLEVIVVDDGSTDTTESLCYEIKNIDKRVKIISINNSGVSHARNVGIDNASGEYITFVDSDDFIDKEMYADLVGNFDENIDIVHCSYKNVDDFGNTISSVGGSNNYKIMNRNEGLECLILGKYFAGGMWNKLYKRSLFNGIRLDENLKINEDVFVNYQLFDKAMSTMYIDTPYYNYVDNVNSATHSAKQLEASEQSLKVSQMILNNSENKSYYHASQIRFTNSLLNHFKNCVLCSNRCNKLRKKDVYDEIKKYQKLGFYKTKKEKITIIILKYFPLFYCKLYFLYDKIRVKKLDPVQ